MPQQDAGTAEQDEAEVVLGVAFVAGVDAAKILEPGEQALDLPAPAVAPEHAAVLGLGSLAVAAVRCDQLDPPLLPEPRVERITVISSVANKAIGCSSDKTRIEGLFDERDFMRRSTRNPGGDRKTMAVCNCHDLGPLPALGLPDGEAPFLAPAKVPSMKASVRSIPPRS